MKLAGAHTVAASALVAGSLVAAAPTDPSRLEITVLGGSTFKLNQVVNENFNSAFRGPRAVAKVYQKFGIPIPSDLLQVLKGIEQKLGISSQQAGQANGDATAGEGMSTDGPKPGRPSISNSERTGQVSALPQMFDSEYLAEVQIGTPPQTLTLDFDTGSSDLWVFSSETAAIDHTGQKLWNPSASTSAKRLSDATWSITYGDGSSSSGDVWLDTVSIGGVTVQGQAVESALQVSSSFTNDTASSGLLGLAFSNINQVKPAKQNTFFTNAINGLAMPLFTANLKASEPGNYNFGFIDYSELSGPITFTNVNATSGFWQFTAEGYQVGASGALVSAPHVAIADTGTTLLMLPEAIVSAYYAQVPTATNDATIGGFVFECGVELPDFVANIAGYKAVVPGSLINFAPADTNSFQTATICFGGIQPSATLPFAIYGDIFLKSQFVIFQGGTMELGFAAKPLASSSAAA